MYTKRIQLVNYGPIDYLDVTFPFEGDTPKPVLLVGENGSGKSILLSYIVNGLVSAKDIIYPETPEVEAGKVYKMRASSYIRSGGEYYFGRVDFEDDLFMTEMRSRKPKRDYDGTPLEHLGSDIQGAWNKMKSEENDYFESSFSLANENKVKNIITHNCVLYFPPNRFEEPAWLNEENLKAQAQYMGLKHIQGYTARKVIDYSPLHDNQNWLFGLIYDRATFELQTHRVNIPINNTDTGIPLPIFAGYSGHAARIYEAALQMVQVVTRRGDARFGIGRRNNRVVSLESDVTGQIVPNIFQLSSGETSLLNLFLSILRDFDLCGAPFTNASDMRGIVVVDEMDLHLHAIHQHEILPNLIRMFPKVQFIVTTHSPLFVLGMQGVFGEDGFALYRLPPGHQISAEEFSEFGDAYHAFTATRRFNDDMRTMIEKSQRPIVFVEGATDQRYIEKASKLFEREAVLEGIELRDGGGKGKLAKVWKDSILPLTEVLPQRVLLLFDCDTGRLPDNKGKLSQRSIPFQDQNPIEKGIENLFNKSTLEMARQHRPAFFITEEEHGGTDENGQPITIPEKWAVTDSEKANLCDWLCENGTPEDFQHFNLIFDLVEEALDFTPTILASAESETTQ